MNRSKTRTKADRIEAPSPKDLQGAWERYYKRLAAHFVSLLGTERPLTVLEAGCGKGQLTIPLLRLLPRGARIVGVDTARGPYSGWLEDFRKTIGEKALAKRVRLIDSDVRRMPQVRDKSVDLVVSNELLCDLPYDRALERALGEFHRVLRPGGLMIHGEWSSSPDTAPQAFLVKHWPSWTPDQLFPIMRKCGFRDFQVSYFGTTIHFGYENAVEELRVWGADNRLIRQHDRLLRREGVELPIEHVVLCRK